jgi:hypothetical protein
VTNTTLQHEQAIFDEPEQRLDRNTRAECPGAQRTRTGLASFTHETGAALASDDQFKMEILQMGLGGKP